MLSRLLLAVALVLSACGTIRSTIGIGPGEQFVLGGGQEGAFRVELLNTGPVPVVVAERSASGVTVPRDTLAPGDAVRASFAAGSAALLINASDREAEVRGVVRGDTDLGMRYAPVGG